MKIKEITPNDFMCHTANCCPAVYETDEGTYLIVGKKLSASAEKLVADKVGDDEYVIEVTKGMIDQLK